jgi:hypothetical protein
MISQTTYITFWNVYSHTFPQSDSDESAMFCGYINKVILSFKKVINIGSVKNG